MLYFPEWEEEMKYAVGMLRADQKYLLPVRETDNDDRWVDHLDDVLYSLKRAGWFIRPPN